MNFHSIFRTLVNFFLKGIKLFKQDDIEFFIVDHESEEEPNWSEFETLKSVYPPDFAKSIAQVCIILQFYPVLAEEK